MRRASLAVLVPLAFLLTGCVFPPLPAIPPIPIPGETLIPADPEACSDGTLEIDQPGEYRIGPCDELVVEGRDIEVIADEVGALIIRGDDVEVDTRAIDILKIEGQSNDVEAGDIGRIDIRGDDNDVDSSGDIESVTINGSSNEVEYAGNLGASDVNGDRNEVRQGR